MISAAVLGADLHGRMDAQLLLLEVDEGTLKRVIPDVLPDTFVITNIFRDQLDRFGELYTMARDLEAVIEALAASATVVLNGDDPLVASFAPNAQARRLYFGIEDASDGTTLPEHAADTIRCVRCQHPLPTASCTCRTWATTLPRMRERAASVLDVAVTAIQPSQDTGSEISVATPAGAFSLRVPQAGLHNVYNAAAAVASALTLSLPRPLEPVEARRAIGGVRTAFGRLEEIRAGDRQALLAFVKNPTSYNTTMREVLQRPGRKHVLAAHSNTVVDGEDFAWLWDVDLEQLVPQMASLTVSGTRAEEVALRFKYAGADPAGIQVITIAPPRSTGASWYAERRITLHLRWLHPDARAPHHHAAARLGAAVLEGVTHGTDAANRPYLLSVPEAAQRRRRPGQPVRPLAALLLARDPATP